MEEPRAPAPEPGESRAERLARALAVMQEWPDTDETAHAFLARHADIKAELQPMLLGTGPDAGTLAGETLLDDRFRIVRLLGRGGMGSVYEAYDSKLQRLVAIKLLRTILQLEDQARARFRREAELMARLQHPNIVAVHEIGAIDGSPFLVMELVDGVPLARLLGALSSDRRRPAGADLAGTLRALLSDGGGQDASLPPSLQTWAGDGEQGCEEQMVAWVIDIAHALDCAHRRGLVHRDVKPSNILITRDGRALLTDFGLAREQGQPGLTVTGEFAGTADYASPEHFGAPTALDARSDVFSLGATLYELLTQQRPFHASSELEIRERVVGHEPRNPSALNRRVPRDLGAVVARALEKAPARRYPDAAAFAADLERWRRGLPVLARPVTVAVRLRRWVARNKLASAFLGLLLSGTVTVSVLAWRTEQLLVGRDIDATGAEVDRVWDRASRVAGARSERVRVLADLLAQARRLCGRQDELAARLGVLRRGGQRVDVAAEAHEHPRLRSELIEQQERATELASFLPYGAGAVRDLLDREIAASRERVARLAAARADTRGWRVDRQEEHDRLADVVWSLDELAARQVPRLERYLVWASRLQEESVRREAAAWHEVSAVLAKDRRFAGVVVPPQAGLVPLGQDPDSKLSEFWVLGSGTRPERDAASGRLRLQGDSGIVLVLLPPRRLAGADTAITGAPFFCAKFEVSVGQMQCIVDQLPLRADGNPAWSVHYPTKPTLPALEVSWDDGKHILGMLDLELPTTEQWVWACRGEDAEVEWWTQAFPDATFADREAQVEQLRAVANLDGGYAQIPAVWPIDQVAIDRPPGNRFAPAPGNRWGLVHMHGNVKEWLADSPLVAVQGTDQRTAVLRSRRLAGGSVADNPDHPMHVIGCNRFDESDRRFRSTHVGLRPVRRVEP